MLVSAGSLQVAPLRGRTGVTGRLVEADEAAGVPEEDQDQDQFPGEADQHPEDHRGGAAGAGSPEEKKTLKKTSSSPVVSSLLVPPQARDQVQILKNLQTNFWSCDTLRPLLL